MVRPDEEVFAEPQRRRRLTRAAIHCSPSERIAATGSYAKIPPRTSPPRKPRKTKAPTSFAPTPDGPESNRVNRSGKSTSTRPLKNSGGARRKPQRQYHCKKRKDATFAAMMAMANKIQNAPNPRPLKPIGQRRLGGLRVFFRNSYDVGHLS